MSVRKLKTAVKAAKKTAGIELTKLSPVDSVKRLLAPFLNPNHTALSEQLSDHIFYVPIRVAYVDNDTSYGISTTQIVVEFVDSSGNSIGLDETDEIRVCPDQMSFILDAAR